MENKKVRVVLPYSIYENFEQDLIDFNIKKNSLCNLIFSRYKEDYMDMLKGYKSKHNKTIQFNLNKKNSYVYYDVLNEYSIQNESEFFRNLIFIHMNKPKSEREKVVFYEKFSRLENAIKKGKKAVIISNSKENLIEPYFIKKSDKENKNYLFCYSYKHKQFINYRLSHIEVKSISNESWDFYNEEEVSGFFNNFDPFLSHKQYVKVKLSKNAIKQYKQAIVNQPKLIKKEGDIFIFESSLLKAKIYFPQFLGEVEILEPLELRKWFSLEVKKMFNIYNS